MARRQRREADNFSLSFLDCICCGFGAVILLLVLSKIYDPNALDVDTEDLEGLVERLEETLFEIRGETVEIRRELVGIRDENSEKEELLRKLRGDFSDLDGQFAASDQNATQSLDTVGSLRSARQRLTAEMRRLQERIQQEQPDAPVAGIPVDSEYIIFIIDTSGSMQQFSWNLVRRKIDEVLNIYPEVKGVQVMNDNGAYLFGSFARRWMTDSPQTRRSIRSALQNWNAFSDSNPVQGIDAAIRTFWAPDKKISLYVFGDEFTGRSVEAVADAVDRINRPDESGRPRVRIHAIGFPLLFNQPGRIQRSTVQFAALMRELCRRNGGTFVALTDRR